MRRPVAARSKRRPGLAAVAAWSVLVALGCACAGGRVVTVETADAALELCAEVATTEAERRQGLRGRAPLAPDEALLLDFPTPDEICIVNDGVDFAIDALYAAPDGTVVAVERAIAAGDPTPRCHPGTEDVLETAAGVLAGVAPGDRLR
ncbi:MAG TPA: DUF192 domain-containing protein [Sandaracinaceae bacterium LLY-WYZ-13_1]|nr:DUF192 domain-containing protein [Sandaracinaceae bacterium LLY-WYZ-13_1]